MPIVKEVKTSEALKEIARDHYAEENTAGDMLEGSAPADLKRMTIVPSLGNLPVLIFYTNSRSEGIIRSG